MSSLGVLSFAILTLLRGLRWEILLRTAAIGGAFISIPWTSLVILAGNQEPVAIAVGVVLSTLHLAGVWAGLRNRTRNPELAG